MIRMIGTTIHLEEKQKEWIESNAINLSKFVRLLLDREMNPNPVESSYN